VSVVASEPAAAQGARTHPRYFPWSVATHQPQRPFAVCVSQQRAGEAAAISFVNPARPGDTIVAYLTGAEPNSAIRTGQAVPVAGGPFASPTSVQVFLGPRAAEMVYGVYHSPYYAGLQQTAFKVPAGLADGFYLVRMQYTDGTGAVVESSELADLIVRTGPAVAGIVPRLVPGEGSDGNPVADVPRQFQGAASFSAASGALITALSSTYAGNFSVPVPAGATTATITLEGAAIEQGDSLFSNFGRIFPLPSDGSSVSFTIPMLQDFVDDSSPPNLISRQGMGYVVGTQPLSTLDNLQIIAQNGQFSAMGDGANVCIEFPTGGGGVFTVDNPQLYPGSLRFYRGDISARWATLPIPVFLNLGSVTMDSDVQNAFHAAANAWNVPTVQFYTESSAPIPADGYGINFAYNNANNYYSAVQSDGRVCDASPLQGAVNLDFMPGASLMGAVSTHELGHGLDQIHPPEGTLIMSPDADVAVVNTYVANGQKANRVLRVAEQYLYQLPLLWAR